MHIRQHFHRVCAGPDGAACHGDTRLGIVALDTGGYSCRSPIRLPSGNPNPHAKGIAIDLSVITLADRRRIAIGHEANSTEALFARTMRQAACGWFTTVLGPGTDAAHAEHFHFDVLRHGASDNYRICE